MGCSASNTRETEHNVVSISRARKRLIKSVVQSRHALSIAHCKYNKSLHSVAMAIRLFIDRHSSQPSPFLMSFSQSSDSPREKEDQQEEERKTEVSIPSSKNCPGWDFFNPFDDDQRAVKEAQGKDGDANVNQGENRGLGVNDSCGNGRELMEALKDVVEHFVKACESGVEVSRMLEINMASHLQSSGSEQIQDGPSKIVQPIRWRGSSSSSGPSSFKSFLASSSSMQTEFKNDIFDEYGGMVSGSHSLTLGRLYAWEKKLYEEVKAGDHMRKIYEQKCIQLRNQDTRGKGSMDKTRAEVRDLHSRILVAIRTIESISQRIQKAKDEELHPQLVELLHSLMRTSKTTLESHETQKQAMLEVKSFTYSAYGKFSNDSHRLATVQLESELQNWRSCFAQYISAQKAYAKALDGWPSKFNAREFDFYSRSSKSSSVLPSQNNGPPLFVICHGWLTSLEKLPDMSVMHAMTNFGKCIRELCAQQGEEQHQKRIVAGLRKELDKKGLAFQRAEGKILESKVSGKNTEVDVKHRDECLAVRKDQLDVLRKKLDAEKAKHCESMQETQQLTLRGFQEGFSSVFKSLMEFSKASLKMYAELVVKSKDSKVGDENGEPSSQ
ncbi:hypothetical protein ACSBR1_009706 [Camellia fascicularis]